MKVFPTLNTLLALGKESKNQVNRISSLQGEAILGEELGADQQVCLVQYQEWGTLLRVSSSVTWTPTWARCNTFVENFTVVCLHEHDGDMGDALIFTLGDPQN